MAGTAQQQHRPNVVLVLTDQLNLWSLSAYQRIAHAASADPPLTPAHETPHIDTLARGGALFTNYMASYAACTPSRHALLTSIHPDRLRRDEHWLDAQTTRRSLGHAFKRSGYSTYYVGKWHLTGDYDNATAEGFRISKTLGTMPAGVAGFDHTRYMFHRTSHPKTAVDIAELGCSPVANASDSSSGHATVRPCPSPIRKLWGARASANASCASADTSPVTWQNPDSSTVLLSNDVPCTDAHLHYATNAIFRWGWRLLDEHVTAHPPGAATAKPALLVLSVPDPHPSVGGYVVRAPYNRYYSHGSRNASVGGGSGGSSGLPASYLDPTPIVTTDVRPFAQRQHELLAGRWKQQHASKVLRMREAFAAMVKVIDDCVGVLVGHLQRAGILDSTLLLFTSDHGDLVGSHGLRGKMTTYDEAVRGAPQRRVSKSCHGLAPPHTPPLDMYIPPQAHQWSHVRAILRTGEGATAHALAGAHRGGRGHS